MNLEGDDLYGFTISDGTVYTLQSTVVDISNTTSTDKFVEAIEDSLLVSNIKPQWILMEMYFLEEMMVARYSAVLHLATANRKWTPNSDRGAVALDGKGNNGG